MKHLIWVPIVLALLALVALGVMRSATGQPHAPEVLAAAGVVIISSTLALVPITLARRSDAVVVFQAAFGGTVIHMFLAVALAAACYVLQLVPEPERRLFLFLLLCFYFVSLIVLVLAMVRVFRKAASAAAHLAPGLQPPPPSPTPQAT